MQGQKGYLSLCEGTDFLITDGSCRLLIQISNLGDPYIEPYVDS